MAIAEELAKFELYLAEGQALWTVNAKLVISREFFELWEEAHQPQPFDLEEPRLTLASQVLMPSGETDLLGYFTWDFDEACAALVIESPNAEQRYLWSFADGVPGVVELPPQYRDEREISLGERLEVIFDIIAWFRLKYPARDVRELRRRDFVAALVDLAPHLPPGTVRVLRRTSFARVRQLFGKAMEDMAVDELSDQLTLPLDGSYAVAAPPKRSAAEAGAPRRGVTITLPLRTKLAVLQDLRFMQSASQAVADLEQGFIIDFRAAEVIARESHNVVVVRLPVNPSQQLQEGDRLPVYRRGKQQQVATFTVDLRERDDALGRVEWADGPVPEEFDDDLFARPRKSPAEYLARRLGDAVAQFGREGAFASAAVSAALGATRATFSTVNVPAVTPAGLDRSQSEAWANAVAGDNPLVLIQGPPGTGKTHVLEQVLRTLVRAGQRLLFVAPSHTAVDNLCRRVGDLPLLRLGREPDSFAPEIAAKHWVGDIEAVKAMVRKRRGKECLYAGTHLGVLRDDVVAADLDKHGPFDVIVFDEAGMARLDEFLLCAGLAQRALLFGDHQQLPPFPLPDAIVTRLQERGAATRRMWDTVSRSALEWLITERQLPVFLLQSSYRCQNPRLMRFSSILFYNARVKASAWAEYYRLSFAERWQRYPPWSLRLYRTSNLPAARRHERLTLDGGRPGIENALEARLAVAAFYELLKRYPAQEITIIAPYRRQVRLIRQQLSAARVRQLRPQDAPSPGDWEDFQRARIATVDSFQGSESEAVIICYVRSNDHGSIGFVDDASRVNVAHTRCRREMVIIGDLAHLQAHARNDLFARLERAVRRDGVVINVTPAIYAQLPENLPIG